MRRTSLALPERCYLPGTPIPVFVNSDCPSRPTKPPRATPSFWFVLVVLPLLGSACAARQEARFLTEKGKPGVATVQPPGDDLAGAVATPPPVPSAPSADTAFHYGQGELQAERYEKAAAWLEQAIALDATHAEYYLWLGRAYGYQAQRAAAGEQFFLARKVRKCFEKVAA